MRIADAEHDLRAGLAPAGTSCTPSASRSRSANEANAEVVPAATRWDTRSSGSRAMVRDRARIASAVTSVASTRRRSRCPASWRPRRSTPRSARSPSWRVCDGWIARDQAVVRALGQQLALDLGAARVGHDDHQRACWCPPRTARTSGKPGSSGRRSRPGDDRCRRRRRRRRPRSPPPALRPRRRRRVRLAEPSPPGTACSAPAPLADRRSGAGADPAGRERADAARAGRGERGATLLGTGRFTPRLHEVEDRRGGHDRHRPAPRSEARDPARRGRASRRRPWRGRTPTRR